MRNLIKSTRALGAALGLASFFLGAAPREARAQVTLPPFNPAGDRVKLCDFEDGQVPPELIFFVNNQYNAGQYTWSIDPTQGANGTHKSLKFHVTSGSPYFYYDAKHVGGPRYISLGKDVNRLSFWMKVPVGWGQHNNQYSNLQVGWYLTNDPKLNETNNGHYYTQIFVVPGSDWMHVVVGDNYDWQRSMTSHSFDPGRALHLQVFDSFFGKLNRFYITGAPNTKGTELTKVPYDMWIDEIELYHEDELVRASPSIVRAAAGTKTQVTISSTSRKLETYQVKVTGLQTDASATVLDESGAAITSLTVNPGGTRQITVAPKTKGGVANVVLYPGKPQDVFVQNRALATRYRGDHAQAGAAILVVGQ